MIYGHGWILRDRFRAGRQLRSDPLQHLSANGWRDLDPDRRIALIEQGLAGAASAAA